MAIDSIIPTRRSSAQCRSSSTITAGWRAGKRGQETWPGTGHLLADSLWLDLVERVVRHRQVGAGSQREEGGLAFAGADSDRLERLLDGLPELLDGVVDRLIERDSAGRAEDLAERPEGDALPGREAPAAKHKHTLVAVGRRGDDLAQHPALADAGRAAQDHQARLTCLDGLVEQAQQRLELPLAADHGRLETNAARVVRGLASQAPSCDRFTLALDDKLDRILEGKDVSRCRPCPLAHQDRARLGRLLQTRGDVDRDRPRRGTGRPARAPTGASTSPVLTPIRTLRRTPWRASNSSFRRSISASISVAALRARIGSSSRADGHAEHRQDRVADVLLDGARPALDDSRHRCEVVLRAGRGGARDRAARRGRSTRSRRRTGSSRSCVPRLDGGRTSRGQRRPAVRAEARVGRNGRAARGASRGCPARPIGRRAIHVYQPPASRSSRCSTRAATTRRYSAVDRTSSIGWISAASVEAAWSAVSARGAAPSRTRSVSVARMGVAATEPNARRTSRQTPPSGRQDRHTTTFEIAWARRVPTFLKRTWRPCGSGMRTRSDELVVAPRGLAIAGPEVVRGDCSFAGGAAEHDLRVGCQQHRQRVAGRGRVDDVAADRAAVLDLRRADRCRGLDQRRQMLLAQVGAPNVRVGGQRSEHQVAVVDGDAAQLVQPPQVEDALGWRSQLAGDLDHQVGAAGDRPPAVARRQQAIGLGQAGGRLERWFGGHQITGS